MNEIELKRRAEAERAAGPIRKLYEMKAEGATLTENTLSGNASVMGVLDRGNDCVFPGSYSKCLKQFLKDGFVPVGHSWSSLPVAMPTKAKEDGQNLYCEATFHSTQSAQDARTVCMERLGAGLSVGLSVGFMPDYELGVAWFDGGVEASSIKAGIIYFDSGESMLKFAKSAGYDMSLFDTKGIKACKGYCRGILAISELYEFSIVAIPMNQRATLTDAKTFYLPSDTDNRFLIPPVAYGDGIHPLVKDVSIPLAYQLPKQLPATIRDFEDHLRELGFSNKQAVDIASVGFAKAMQRESAKAPEADAMPEPVTMIATDDDGLLRKLQAAQLRFSPLLTEVNHEL